MFSYLHITFPTVLPVAWKSINTKLKSKMDNIKTRVLKGGGGVKMAAAIIKTETLTFFTCTAHMKEEF